MPDAQVHRRCDGPPGLGDRLASVLYRTGATWLYFKLRRLFYMIEEVDGGCGGCKRRQEKLNRAGRWVAKWWARVVGCLRFWSR